MVNLLDEEDEFLARYVTWALWALAIVVCIATVTGQVESYNGLYIWFATHHVTGFWADFAPLAVDSFTVIGELAIFAGISRHWDWKSRILPWASAMLGIVSSVAANVGDKVQYHSIPTDLTGAIFPLAGAFGLVIGLGVLKRVARDHKMNKAKKRDSVTTEQINAVVEKTKPAFPEDYREPVTVGSEPWTVSPAIENTFVPAPVYPTSEELAGRAHYEKDREHKGMDVLIPPTPESRSADETFSWAGIVQPPTGPMPAPVSSVEPVRESREEQRRRGATDTTYAKQIYQTGAFDAIS